MSVLDPVVELARGLGTTLKMMFERPVTVQYPEEKREVRPPFHGKISAVDKTAKTITVGERTFQVTATTKIQMAGKPASLEDAKVGDQVGGQYREGEGGRLEVLSLRVGPKPEKKPKTVETK